MSGVQNSYDYVISFRDENAKDKFDVSFSFFLYVVKITLKRQQLGKVLCTTVLI